MSTQIKHLIFKGIEKKEQILFKSFLNLAKNELPYQVIISQEGDLGGETPDIIIVDAKYSFSEDESALENLPSIVVGTDVSKDGENGYISRPVQWSDFKDQLSHLDVGNEADDEAPQERVLPDEAEFEIAETGDNSVDSESTAANSQSFSDAEEYDYELDNMSVDYQSFADSEFVKVADEVEGFKDGEVVDADTPNAVILVTDDESSSHSSVLVIETDSLDAWEMSDTEYATEVNGDDYDEADYDELPNFGEDAEKQIAAKLKSGIAISQGERYWAQDSEILAGRESFLFIKAEREMVYSSKEPGKWTHSLRSQELTKLPIADDWTPTSDLRAYPINRLYWAEALVNKTDALEGELDENQDYMLERWPDFELLQLDNTLLKLCTMLFVNPESATSLIKKSGYSQSVVYGLMNACRKLDILKEADEVELEQLSVSNVDAGMIGKIKDVFR